MAVPTEIVALVTAAAVMPTVVAHEVQNEMENKSKTICIGFFIFFKTVS